MWIADWCRSMNPFPFTLETNKTVIENIYCMLKNYLLCEDNRTRCSLGGVGMTLLNEKQIKEMYFQNIGGFPPNKHVKEVKDYKGEEYCCIACTQLDYLYSERDAKRILNEWIDFLRTNTKTFKALHFNTRVSQKLFDAACCQENLEELRFKWVAIPIYLH